jgi:hypothetical protein
VVQGCLNDGVGGVEVSMGEVVAHACDIANLRQASMPNQTDRPVSLQEYFRVPRRFLQRSGVEVRSPGIASPSRTTPSSLMPSLLPGHARSLTAAG